MYYAFEDVHPREIIDSVSHFRPGWIFVIVFFQAGDLAVRALRWKILLRPVVNASAWTLYQVQAISLAMNNLLFFRIGELAKAVIGGREYGVSTMSVFATVVVERLCDTAALLAVFSVGACFVSEGIDPRLRCWLAVACAGIFSVLLFVVSGGVWLQETKLFKRLERFPAVYRLACDTISGTRALGSWRAALEVGALSIGMWLFDGAMFWAGAKAVGLDPDLSYGRSIIVLASAAASTALPALPGAWGNFEAGVKAIIHHFGYAKSSALSYAAFIHLIMYVTINVMGISFFYRLGHTFDSLRRGLEKKG